MEVAGGRATSALCQVGPLDAGDGAAVCVVRSQHGGSAASREDALCPEPGPTLPEPGARPLRGRGARPCFAAPEKLLLKARGLWLWAPHPHGDSQGLGLAGSAGVDSRVLRQPLGNAVACASGRGPATSPPPCSLPSHSTSGFTPWPAEAVNHLVFKNVKASFKQ